VTEQINVLVIANSFPIVSAAAFRLVWLW